VGEGRERVKCLRNHATNLIKKVGQGFSLTYNEFYYCKYKQLFE